MKRQVQAIFIFIGVVAVSAAFLQGKLFDPSEQIVTYSDDVSEIGLSDYGVASAILAMRDQKNDNPFGFPNEGAAGEPALDPIEEVVVEPVVPPTICNIYITQPDLGQIVSTSLVVSGFVDDIPSPECLWTVFEANAGGVEVYDSLGNLLSEYNILSSVGDWMQFPSHFQSFVSLSGTPQIETGYIRFYEHPAEGVADVFDYPISFNAWTTPGEVSDGSGFFDSIASFFRPKPIIAPIVPDSIFSGEDTVDEVVEPEIQFDRVPFSDQTENFCEVRKEEKLVCYGEYVDEDKEVCGCTTFSGLESFHVKQNLKNYTVDLEEATFEKTLFVGDRGDSVRSLQEALFILGYYDQIPSGVYDGKTVKASRSFQKENNLPGWGLIVGVKTNGVLSQLFSN